MQRFITPNYKLMKPLFTAFAILVCTWISAQHLTAGPVIGLNYSQIQVDEHFAIESKEYAFEFESPGIGPSVGAYGKMTLGSIYLQGQVRFSQERSTMTMTNWSTTQLQTYSTTRLQVPVVMGYRFNDLHFFMGPVVNHLIDASLVPSNEDKYALYKEANRKTSLGYQMGIGVQVDKAVFSFQYMGAFTQQGLALTYQDIPLNFKQRHQVMLISFNYQIFNSKQQEVRPKEKELIVPPPLTVSEE